MKFRRLRLAGFKSFVEPAALEIEDGLTGVVGPNGCGKSNLLEAMRWTMGESSPKSMRGGGMEDVIFAGTDRRSSRDIAEVVLTLDNQDRRAPPPFNDSETIEVSRRIERGLGSLYRINGRDVRQKDVQLLFADAATGAHSPALVSQGRVGAIVNAKPQDRRQLLEEAAGISGLHVRRREAEQRLSAAEANLARLSDLLSGLESQAAGLRRQARTAERYAKVSERIRLAEAMLLFAHWRRARRDAETATAALSSLEADVTAAQREMARLVNIQKQAKTGLPAARDAERAAEAALAALKQEQERLRANRREGEQRVQVLSETIARARGDDEREAAVHADAEQAARRLADEADMLTSQIQAQEAGLPKHEADEEAAGAKVDAAERDLADALTEHAEMRAARLAAGNEQAAAQRRLARAEEGAAREQRRLSGLPCPAALEKAQAEAAAEGVRCGALLDSAQQAAAAAEQALTETEAKAGSVQSTRAEAAARLSALDAEAKSLAQQIAQADGEVAEPLVGAVAVEPGFEAAFAGAFGAAVRADLAGGSGAEGGPDGDRAHWLIQRQERGPLPPLPDGVAPLTGKITGPARISARLAMTGFVEETPGEAVAAALAPGQSIVNRQGALWRWDGLFVPAAANSGAARLLRARSRLQALNEARKSALAAEEDASAQCEALDAERSRARQALRDARETLSGASDAARAAQGQLLDADAALSRAAGQRADAERAAAAAQSALDEAKAEVETAETALAALPKGDGPAIREERARRAAEEARAALAQLRADRQSQTRQLAEGRARADAVERERADWAKRLAAVDTHRAALAERVRAGEEEQRARQTAALKLKERLAALAPQMTAAEGEAARLADARATAETAASVHDDEAMAAQEHLAALRERRGRLSAERDTLEERRLEMTRLASERFQTAVHVLPAKLGFDEDEAEDGTPVKAALDRLTAERERLGPVNLRAEAELEALRTEIDSSNADSEDLHAAIARLRGSIGAINREGRARLLTAFEEVDRHFRSLFTGLFGGGAARLELVESDDPLSAGLEVMAQPPGKALQSLSLLSGGEQALTAVALIFAIFLTNPAPICVLDEVDAPLDDANIERFCDLLDRMTVLTDTRFLVVTHNAVTMSRMHRLFGVTMAEKGVSQLVSVDLGGAETLVAA